MIKVINSIPKEILDVCENLKFLFDIKLRKEGNVSHIGAGSHGDVYRVFDKYAVKIFAPKAVSGNYLDYIYLEQLQGIPYVPVLYGYYEKKFMIMEYVEGQNLYDYFLSHKHLPPNFKDLLADAMTCIFEKNIILTECKVAEHVIWNDKTGKLKLIDFGVCDSCAHMPLEFNKRITRDWINSAMEDIDEFLAEMSHI